MADGQTGLHPARASERTRVAPGGPTNAERLNDGAEAGIFAPPPAGLMPRSRPQGPALQPPPPTPGGGSAKLLCRNGCGFFGNPEWHWYCSKCWRAHPQRSLVAPPTTRSSGLTLGPPASPRSRPASAGTSAGGGGSTTRSSGDPRASHSGPKAPSGDLTLRQRLKLTPKSPRSPASATGAPSGPPATFDWRQHLSNLPHIRASTECLSAGQVLASHLRHWVDGKSLAEIWVLIHTLLEKIDASHETTPIDTIASQVQEVYLTLRAKFIQWDVPDDDLSVILEQSEAYLSLATYPLLFCPSSTNDEEKDLRLQNRIRSLNWITTQELRCVIQESSQRVRDLLHDAINDIVALDSQQTPQAKLKSLVTCCKKLIEMLLISNEKAASADEFLPCLIYVCLKANPPRLQSNVNYITRFCIEDNLRMGDGGYYFASLCSALSFIENMDAASVDMDSTDFHNYVTGRSLPPGSWKCTLLMSEGLQVMVQNKRILESLSERQHQALTQTTSLSQQMDNFAQEIHEEVADILRKTAYVIKAPRTVKRLHFPVTSSSTKEPPCSKLVDLPTPTGHQLSLDNFEGCSTQNAIPGIVCQNLQHLSLQEEDDDLM
ncbi:hypothetical protein TCAL_10698 [Tigriopus californicus]|uniref:VPS9 domain-containing protein n=2 Tax=Tigriopus californicus TaxID=6832 RepID=A0A553P000_TIGCA|nr:hypothetical protein TCAL_10698 [Tigriopus californicus]